MLKGRRFSPAMIVAMIALAIALSGTAVAGTTALITSNQIANGTIKMVDLAPSTKLALKGQRGPAGEMGIGTRGATGPRAPLARQVRLARRASRASWSAGRQGRRGPAGPAGGFNPAKLSYITGADVNVPAGESARRAPAADRNAGDRWRLLRLDRQYRRLAGLRRPQRVVHHRRQHHLDPGHDPSDRDLRGTLSNMTHIERGKARRRRAFLVLRALSRRRGGASGMMTVAVSIAAA